MARIKRNSLVNGASGTVAGDIVFKTYYDKTVISKKPDMSNVVLSEKQKKMTRRMIAANAYASTFYVSEEKKIQARVRLKLPAHKSLFHALVKEWMEKEKSKG
jgi:hypothetical protein